MKLPGDEILRTYIEDDGTEVTVVKGCDGKIYHCWKMDCPKDVVQMIEKGAKQYGIEEWEYINMALEEAMKQHEEEQTKRAFIEEISE